MHAIVQQKWLNYPADVQQCLQQLRSLILEVAAADPQVGSLEETLKWGEAAFLTSQSNSGTTIRLGWSANRPEYCGLYVHCQTTLISTYQTLFPKLFHSDGNRGLLFKPAETLPEMELKTCIGMALRYHLDKG